MRLLGFQKIEKLTVREKLCLQFSANGMTAKQVGRELEIEAGTVVAHLKNTRNKLNAKNLIHAYHIAIRNEELTPFL